MTDDQHGEGRPPSGGGRWDPLPQGDYDDGATAFVKLPEGGIEALLAGEAPPLAAPGHGYVPPPIAAAPPTDDTGTWATPAGGSEWPAQTGPQTVGDDRFTYNPGSTGQWNFEEATGAAAAPGGPGASGAPGGPGGPGAAGHEVTGQWSIPVVGGDLPDETGEFTQSSLVEQWGGGTPPATLPGGAQAPWATGATDGAGQSWAQQAEAAAGHTGVREPVRPDTPEYGHAPEHGGAHDPARGREYGGEAGERVERPERPERPERSGQPPAGYDTAPAPSRDTQDQAPQEGVRSAAGPTGTSEDATGRQEAAEAPQRPATPSAGPESEAPRNENTTAPDRAHAPDAPDADEPPPPPAEEHPLASYVLRVNDADRPVTDAWIGESLLYVLRERLGLAGAKDGCSQGECGACNVQVDGRLVASCLVPAVTTAGSEIRTVEGLAVDGQPSDVQRALARCGAVQCGFCVPGMAMTVHDLLEGNPAPTELETRQALCGNLCRCSGYKGVLRAVKDVVAEREALAEEAEAEADADGDEARIPHQAGPGAGGVHASAFENPAQPHPHDPSYDQAYEQGYDQAYGPAQDGGQA